MEYWSQVNDLKKMVAMVMDLAMEMDMWREVDEACVAAGEGEWRLMSFRGLPSSLYSVDNGIGSRGSLLRIKFGPFDGSCSNGFTEAAPRSMTVGTSTMGRLLFCFLCGAPNYMEIILPSVHPIYDLIST